MRGALAQRAQQADGLALLPRRERPDGSPHRVVRPPVLAIETARFVGEAVALVVAETLAIAKDAAEAVYVAYEEMSPIAREVPDVLAGYA